MVPTKQAQAKEHRLWVVDQAVAYVDNGRVTLQIDKPTRHLPRRIAFEVADKIWFAGQMRELEIARQRCETKMIPLTDRRRRSSLRMGGGFMITQGTNLLLIQRTMDAPRPGQFCECGGVFEFVPQDPINDPEDLRNDFIASLLRESQEIILVRGDTLYIPRLPPPPSKLANPSAPIGFEPPGTLDAYNSIIEEEAKEGVTKARIPVSLKNIKRFWMKILDYEQSVRLQFGYSPEVFVEITAEIDTSSLEVVGVLSWPQDIDKAVEAFEASQHNKSGKEEKVGGDMQQKEEFEYWDAELRPPEQPTDRPIHLINIETGEDIVWFVAEAGRRRESRKSTLWKELSASKLGETGGRFATEKIEKAIKMHCPFPRLQPLARL